jgi:hypothetical protein
MVHHPECTKLIRLEPELSVVFSMKSEFKKFRATIIFLKNKMKTQMSIGINR